MRFGDAKSYEWSQSEWQLGTGYGTQSAPRFHVVAYDFGVKINILRMLAGADFIKTSTGKISPAATPPVVLVMLEAVRDFYKLTGRRIGVKPAGGIRTTRDAIKQLVLVNETAGPEWLDPNLFRIGASALLNDLLMQRMKMKNGQYSGRNYVKLD